jgi:crotonobetainyl-CoA:carnitine CoA-transferase CaiB-like acyl-CoA transferase
MSAAGPPEGANPRAASAHGEEGPCGPLAGVRVLDLSSVIMGPYATQLLGDMGADIVKIESPDGDTTRQAGHAKHPGMGAVFLTIARNKRSLVLDLKQPAAMAVLVKLVATADVLVHNLRPAATRALGLDYERIAPLNPRLVYCAARGFRSDGPYGEKPAYDDMIQGASGTAAVMAAVTGEPAYVPMIYADKVVGLFVANAITMALYARERTGRGQAVEVPMFEAVSAFTLVEHLYDATFEPPRGPPGYPRVTSRARRPFRTRDGYVCALPYTDRHFERFFALAGRAELAHDPRFASIAARLKNVDALYGLVGEVLATDTTAAWLERLGRAEIPAMAVATLDDLLADPHLAATGFFELHEHPTEGTIRHYGLPMRFDATPGAIRRPAPRLGEHSAELLREAGCEADEIERLFASRASIDGRA